MHKTDRKLGTKLGICHNLDPFDRTDMWLGDADSPIVNVVDLPLIHGFLLRLDFMDDQAVREPPGC